MASIKPIVLIGLVLASLPAAATSYCCTDDNGRRVCGDVVPNQCLRRAYQEINSQGAVIKEIEAPLTPEQRARREAELLKKREAERAAEEKVRREKALLASYGSVKDIDAKRDRVLADSEALRKLTQQRYDETLGRKKELEKELEFYKKKPVPEKLKNQIRENQLELDERRKDLANKMKEVETITAYFEEEKQRYLAIVNRR